jgi:hypothetical protein
MARKSAVVRPDDPATLKSAMVGKSFRPWRGGVAFKWKADGCTVAEVCNNTASQVTVTYFGLARELHQVRTFVVAAKKRGSVPTVNDLRRHLRATPLFEIADDQDLTEWIEIFLEKRPRGPKAVALVFLEKKTGLLRGALKTYFSKTAKAKKVHKSISGDSSMRKDWEAYSRKRRNTTKLEKITTVNFDQLLLTSSRHTSLPA